MNAYIDSLAKYSQIRRLRALRFLTSFSLRSLSWFRGKYAEKHIARAI